MDGCQNALISNSKKVVLELFDKTMLQQKKVTKLPLPT